MYAQTAYPVIDLAETGRCIERQHRRAGLTVRDLQDYFGFEYPQAIYKWQHGECLPTVDNLLALARLLRVSMEDLLVYEDQGVSHFLAEDTSWSGCRLYRVDHEGVWNMEKTCTPESSAFNYRFNDRLDCRCYPMHVDREKGQNLLPRQEPDRAQAP